MLFRKTRPKSFQLLSWRHASSTSQLEQVPEHEPIPATALTQIDRTFSEEVLQEYAAFDLPGSLESESADPDPQSLPFAGASGTRDTAVNTTQRTQSAPGTTSNAMRLQRRTSDPIQCPPRKPKPRYYKQAFTDEDTEALARGEQNHNLTPWTPADLVMHDELLNDLRPLPLIVDHSSRSSILVDAHGTTTQTFSRPFRTGDKVRYLQCSDPLPRIEQSGEKLPQEENRFDAEFQREVEGPFCGIGSPLYSSRSSSAPVLIIPAHDNLLPENPAPRHSVGAFPEHSRTSSATRVSESLSIPAPLSRAFSFTSSQTRHAPKLPSPLSLSPASSFRTRDPEAFKPNPETTFDSFLGPHKSGKGETHADYVKRKKVADGGGRLRKVRKSLMLGWEPGSSSGTGKGSGSAKA
ncbi:hypothetical protein IQ07DRAFT_653558 [Pyrenochaeta sp. DS3sAY3a]|nr:hypothetical protein IQ07DRAFT_653558 [Pyrenochaeta sp. DS3sAY3a]